MFNHSTKTSQIDKQQKIEQQEILAAFIRFNKQFKLIKKKVHETPVNKSDYLLLQQGKSVSPLFQNIVKKYNRVVAEYQIFMKEAQPILNEILPEKEIQLIKESLKIIPQGDKAIKLRYFPGYQEFYRNTLADREKAAEQKMNKAIETASQKTTQIKEGYKSRQKVYGIFAAIGGGTAPAGIGVGILLIDGLIALTDMLITSLRLALCERDIQSAREQCNQTDKIFRSEIKQSIHKDTGNQLHQRFFKLEKHRAKLEALAPKETSQNQIKNNI